VDNAGVSGFPKLQWRLFTARTVSARVAGDVAMRTHAGDADLLASLIRLFDNRNGVYPEGEGTNPVLDEGVNHDKRVLYLRIVHSFDFYSGAGELLRGLVSRANVALFQGLMSRPCFKG
jgi:hypothetical protein